MLNGIEAKARRFHFGWQWEPGILVGCLNIMMLNGHMQGKIIRRFGIDNKQTFAKWLKCLNLILGIVVTIPEYGIESIPEFSTG